MQRVRTYRSPNNKQLQELLENSTQPHNQAYEQARKNYLHTIQTIEDPLAYVKEASKVTHAISILSAVTLPLDYAAAITAAMELASRSLEHHNSFQTKIEDVKLRLYQPKLHRAQNTFLEHVAEYNKYVYDTKKSPYGM